MQISMQQPINTLNVESTKLCVSIKPQIYGDLYNNIEYEMNLAYIELN